MEAPVPTSLMTFSKQLLGGIRVSHSAIGFDPLKCERWIASSVLQKAIRRADVELAYRAACTLLDVDRSAVWRRLILIAFEDVGAGDIGPCSRPCSWPARASGGGDTAR